MTIPPNEIGDDDDETNVGIYDATFSEPQTSFLTLFRMMLGSFDMIWFQKKHDRILTLFAYLLFIICKVLFSFFFFNFLPQQNNEHGYISGTAAGCLNIVTLYEFS
jgi:hypothetical protein